MALYYFFSSGKAKDCFLGLKRVFGFRNPLCRENMAQSIVLVLDYYELQDRIGYFVLDNISRKLWQRTWMLDDDDDGCLIGWRKLSS
jgi:hypothetical protein